MKSLEKNVKPIYTWFMGLFNRIIAAVFDFILSQKQNFILWTPVFIGIGAAWYFSLSNEPDFKISILSITPLLLLGALAQYAFTVSWFETLGQKILAAGLIILSLTFLGYTAGIIRTHFANTHMIDRNTRPMMVTGTITHMDQKEDKKNILFIMDNLTIENMAKSETPKSVRIASRLKNSELKVGDTITALMILQPFKPPVNQGAYDFRRHYFFNDIGGMGFLLKPPEAISKPKSTIDLTLISWREQLRTKIEKILQPRAAGIVTALMTGERAAITDIDWDNLRHSGLAHIISISGLHVAMVATSIFFVVRLLLALLPFLALRFSIKKVAALAALIGCALYVGFVVPTVPTTRSLLMTGIALIAVLLDRSPFSLRLIALSAVALLLVLPESIWSASFQLSFAAVTLLVAAAEVSRPYWSKFKEDAGFIRKIILYVGASVGTTIVATIATAPYSSFHFGQIANYSVLANGLAIPITAIIIMPMLIVAFLALPFHLESLPLKLMGWGVDKMLDIADYVAHLPHAITMTPIWPFSALVLVSIAGLLFCFILGRGKFLCLIPLLAAGFIILTAKPQTIFISPEHKLVMVYEDKNKIFISSMRRDKFAREEWLQFLGLSDNTKLVSFPKEGVVKTDSTKITCDRGACRIETPDQKITFGNSWAALQEDCNWADIIITEKYFAPKTCKSIIQDRQSTKQTQNRPWIP